MFDIVAMYPNEMAHEYEESIFRGRLGSMRGSSELYAANTIETERSMTTRFNMCFARRIAKLAYFLADEVTNGRTTKEDMTYYDGGFHC